VPNDRRNTSLAESLKPFMRGGRGKLTVRKLMDEVEIGDGPGPLLLLLTLPVLLPLPPGVSMLLALPLLIVAPQMALGRRELWMPKALAAREIDRAKLKQLLTRVMPWLSRAERVVRPRLSFLTGRVGARLASIVCALLALVLVLPIPFANLVPALALSAFALGLSRRDGLFVLAGYGLVALAAVVIALGVDGVRIGVGDLRRLL